MKEKANQYRVHFEKHKKIVIKIGTSSITHSNGKINLKKLKQLSWILTDLHSRGKDIVLVSSGAIAVGADRLSLPERPRDIIGKQAASAVGQAALMQIYQNFFLEVNQNVAQILLTRDVLENENRKHHAKNTFNALLEMGVIPIVNENDTVSVEELEFSDNDTLSAYVACLVKADLLIMLSDIDGLKTEDPKKNPDAKLISYVAKIDESIEKLAGGAGSSLGTGGMATKISASKMANKEGIDTIIANSEDLDCLYDIIDGIEIGTLFKGV